MERRANPLKAAIGQCWRALAWVLGFSLLINLLVLTSPIYMMQVFDRVLSSGRLETLVSLTLIAGVAVLTMGAFETVRSRMLARIGGWLDRTLAPDLIGAGLHETLAGRAAGAQPLRDLAMIRHFVGGPAINAVFDVPWLPIFLVVVWLVHPWLGWIGLAAAIVLILAAVLNELLSRRLLQAASRLAIANAGRAEAASRNADAVHAMGMLPGFLRHWVRQNDDALDRQLRASDRSAVMIGFSRFFRMFVQLLVLGTGASLVLQADLTSGGMIAVSILLGRALAPIDQAIGAWKGLVGARDAYSRILRLLEGTAPQLDSLPLPAPKGLLVCENVIVVPAGAEQPALQGIHFTLQPGEMLGVTGPSAAGKSTLCRILVGTWRPTRGRVSLDGADVFTWSREQIGPYLGYLPQDVELFAATVGENIARLSADPDPEAVLEAASVAGIHEMILRLPDGYDTVIGDGGRYLSGGQRQRIGLARALYGRPRLIVLDEPNAFLDGEGERALIAAQETARRWGSTLVIVAQHPRVLGPADKLLVLRDGRMEQFGTRDEVLARLRPPRHAGAPRPRVMRAATALSAAPEREADGERGEG